MNQIKSKYSHKMFIKYGMIIGQCVKYFLNKIRMKAVNIKDKCRFSGRPLLNRIDCVL